MTRSMYDIDPKTFKKATPRTDWASQGKAASVPTHPKAEATVTPLSLSLFQGEETLTGKATTLSKGRLVVQKEVLNSGALTGVRCNPYLDVVYVVLEGRVTSNVDWVQGTHLPGDVIHAKAGVEYSLASLDNIAVLSVIKEIYYDEELVQLSDPVPGHAPVVTGLPPRERYQSKAALQSQLMAEEAAKRAELAASYQPTDGINAVLVLPPEE